MPEYRVPLSEIAFALQVSGGLDGVDEDIVSAVLNEASRFAEDALATCYEAGDREGCTWRDTEVTTPSGFAEAYKTFCEGGWPALAQDEAFGGQGLPLSLQMAMYEMLTSSNLAWALYPTITWGSIATISAHGTDEQKAAYLPKMISGEWTGTMCLTESHAGSDLGLLRAKATPIDDQRYAISGTKIFISSGEHDFTDNIVHLTLARLPDAPEGTGGISLFIVPKVLPNGERNAVSCGGIEEKMGIHGNATCTMNFDGAEGYLLGKPNRGLMAMFTLINESRVEVCLQAQGQMERAYQTSLTYAKERRQMRSNPRFDAGHAADPIIAHGDVQRMLLTQRTFSEAARLLAYRLATLLQQARHGDGAEEVDSAERALALLTPIAKGFISENAQEAASLAIQVFGGHGFITETGVEQLYRDVRITAIYEGTTAIQGVDLLTRKLFADDGAQLQAVMQDLKAEVADSPLASTLQQALWEWQELTGYMLADVRGNDLEVNASAVAYLMYSGYVISACLLAKAAAAEGSNARHQESAAFYCKHILPRTQALKASIQAGAVAGFTEIDV
jgi:alkylation response protein AidB-like acyl-CoA dehydrogenase